MVIKGSEVTTSNRNLSDAGGSEGEGGGGGLKSFVFVLHIEWYRLNELGIMCLVGFLAFGGNF